MKEAKKASSTSARLQSVAYPLNEFRAETDSPLPTLSPIDGAEMPLPYRDLLVHKGDMTPTLEAFYGGEMNLRVLRVRRTATTLFREVVLTLKNNGRAVEYGAIKIHLELFHPEARAAIIEGRRPLGTLLRIHNVTHLSSPKAFFAVQSDNPINAALDLNRCCKLYGRRNTLSTVKGDSLAEIVEILAPAEVVVGLAKAH